MTLGSSRQICENNTQMSNFMDVRLVGPSCAIRTDGRIHRRKDGRPDTPDEANNRFSQFCEKRFKKNEKLPANYICMQTDRMDLKICTNLITNEITSAVGLP
jgi:hypothetical protein